MRVLVSIGCDTYAAFGTLGGAEADASAVYKHLVTDRWGDYDPDKSVLMLSPANEEVRRVLTEILFGPDSLDELTVFFAGHGAVKDDAYFLCLRDTVYARLTVSALSLATMFGWIAEAKVRQTNLVFDACQSGGVARDIGYLLSPGVMGAAGSPGISILAASASDQEALEVGGRGLCTTSLIRCLKGEIKVQSTRPTLDLVEVGRVVSNEFRGTTQQPVCWGLNLLGRGQFAKNPHYGGSEPHVEDMLPPLNDPSINALVSKHAPEIWKCYSASQESFDPTMFAKAVGPALEEVALRDIAAAGIFLDGIDATFGASLVASSDLFAETQMHATCAALWLGVASGTGPDPEVSMTLLHRVYQSGLRAVTETTESLSEYRYNLLGLRSGLPDLFYLPTRLLRLLGWMGALQHTASLIHEDFDASMEALEDRILEFYSSSIVAVSDEQAAFWTSYVSAPDRAHRVDVAEQFLGLLFNSFVKDGGVVARPGLSGFDA